ncbi:MAG: alpha/beta hydrolase, partial [Pseudomonadota bacterium]
MKHFVPPSRRGPLARSLAALMMALLLVTSYAHAQQRNPL